MDFVLKGHIERVCSAKASRPKVGVRTGNRMGTISCIESYFKGETGTGKPESNHRNWRGAARVSGCSGDEGEDCEEDSRVRTVCADPTESEQLEAFPPFGRNWGM